MQEETDDRELPDTSANTDIVAPDSEKLPRKRTALTSPIKSLIAPPLALIDAPTVAGNLEQRFDVASHAPPSVPPPPQGTLTKREMKRCKKADDDNSSPDENLELAGSRKEYCWEQ